MDMVTRNVVPVLLALAIGMCSNSKSVSDHKTVFLVRHAEKCLEPADDPPLTDEGLRRAEDLVRLLEYHNIDRIYSTPFARTLETAGPLSDASDVDITVTPVRDYVSMTAEAIRSDKAMNIVVVGHSDTTPSLVNKLAGTSLPNIADEEYDHIFIVRIADDSFASLERFRFGAVSGSVKDCP